MPGQFLVVDQLVAPTSPVFRQMPANGSTGSWAFVLQPQGGSTRMLFRRHISRPSLFDRIAGPGYLLMDWAMLRGIRRRAEQKLLIE